MTRPGCKIMIFGKPGAGKSTYAFSLHQELKIPLHHLDAYFFSSNWQKRDYAEFMQIQHDLVGKQSWIIDGNCTRSLETRYARTDICIYFNPPVLTCLWGIIKRRFFKNQAIKDRADACYETITWQLISYLLTFEIRVHDALANLKERYPQVTCIEIQHRSELEQLTLHIRKRLDLVLE